MLLELSAISKEFPRFRLGPLSFSLAPGTLNGFAGPNGSGKSTTLKILAGLLGADAGEIRFAGERVVPRAGLWKTRLGFVGERQPFYERWTVARNLELFARLQPRWCPDWVAQLIDRLELDPEEKVVNLSRGNRVKLAFVAAIGHRPDLLLLDEPTAGLDPASRTSLLDILSAYTREGQRAVLFSTHIIADLSRLADSLVLIREGRLAVGGTPDELTEPWRRLRFRYPYALPDLPNVVDHRVDGDWHLLVTSAWREVRDLLESKGAAVRDANRLSLEEAAVLILKGHLLEGNRSGDLNDSQPQ